MSLMQQTHGMKRALSKGDEDQVTKLYEQRAKQIGIETPLTPKDWYAVKDHLRMEREHANTAEWSKEDIWLYSMACANLAIDPIPTKNGVRGLGLAAMMWLASPADCHGRLSEGLRIATLTLLAAFVGLVGLLVAHLFTGNYSMTAFVLGCMSGLLVLGMFTSGDTYMGVGGIACLMMGIQRITSLGLAEATGLEITGGVIAVIIGGLCVVQSIRIRG